MNITDIKGTTTLNNGREMPYFGLGVWQSEDGQEVVQAIHHAVNFGYRLIDTAAIYRNEEGVGEAIRSCGVARKELFVTSKVWNSDQGYEPTIKACEASLKRLGMDYVDLYLIHWPVKGEFKETWRAMEELVNRGWAKSIGVSNFMRHHLDDLLTDAKLVPTVNQMEFHPRLRQQDLVDYCQSKKIAYQAWSPLMQGGIFKIPELKEIAERHDKSVAQVVLRWNLQKGVLTIPKSVKKDRIESNGSLFDFALSSDEVKLIDGLDRGERVGPDPDNFSF